MKTHYEVLQVTRDASQAVIRASYMALTKSCHPDVNPGDAQAEEKTKQLNEAYAVLSNPDKRAAYDRELKARRPQAVPFPGVGVGFDPTAYPLAYDGQFDVQGIIENAARAAGGAFLSSFIGELPPGLRTVVAAALAKQGGKKTA